MENIILVVDDNEVQRTELSKIIEKEYFVMDAITAEIGLEILKYNQNCISAIFVNLSNGNNVDFIERFFESDYSINIPLIATVTQSDDDKNEILRYGIDDFIVVPYNKNVVMFRLKNAISRKEILAFKKIQYKYDFDVLTGIYSKDKFFENTANMLETYNTEGFSFFRFDVNRFHLINQYFGIEKGDKLLKYIAERIIEGCNMFYDKSTYGRIEADVFAFCIPTQDEKRFKHVVDYVNEQVNKYDNSFDISTTIGIAIIDNNFSPVDEIYDKANIAAKSSKGSYSKNYSIYTAEMGKQIETEQNVINEMNNALAENQFEIWYQPKQDIKSNLPAGAEALVRWNHPEKGIVSPVEFIPVFERNGLITKLDYYVWEKVCSDIHNWIEDGFEPLPISVNVSRVDIAEAKIVDNIINLVDKYNIPHKLFNLELTESAYTDNPKRMIEIMKQFKENGFIIMMDDFGSGYSSLAILKDIDVDVLKIDTRFFEKSTLVGRGRSIIASVIRMAKWLHIPVVAEGIEDKEQVEFLRGLGCEYVQGYYFSKPMPKADFIKYIESYKNKTFLKQDAGGNENFEKIWNSNSIISDIIQPAAVFEFCDDKLEIIHLNNSFYDSFGFYEKQKAFLHPLDYIDEEYRERFLKAIKDAIKYKSSSVVDYKRHSSTNSDMWVHMKIKYISDFDNKYILYAVFVDITSIISLDEKLEQTQNLVDYNASSTNRLLIVDDDETSRKILNVAFNKDYSIIEAKNGKEALQMMEKYDGKFDLVLLDLLMPVMNGIEFLNIIKNNERYENVPVIVTTSDSSDEKQINAIEIGASDYIVKPFVKEVAVKRAENVISSFRVDKVI